MGPSSKKGRTVMPCGKTPAIPSSGGVSSQPLEPRPGRVEGGELGTPELELAEGHSQRPSTT
jgi:hypothetical protein